MSLIVSYVNNNFGILACDGRTISNGRISSDYFNKLHRFDDKIVGSICHMHANNKLNIGIEEPVCESCQIISIDKSLKNVITLTYMEDDKILTCISKSDNGWLCIGTGSEFAMGLLQLYDGIHRKEGVVNVAQNLIDSVSRYYPYVGKSVYSEYIEFEQEVQ